MEDGRDKKWPPSGVDTGVVKKLIDKFRSPTPQEIAEGMLEEAEARVKRAKARQKWLNLVREQDPELVEMIEKL